MSTLVVAMSDEKAKTLSLRVDVKHFSREEGENLTLSIGEIEMAA